MTSSLRDTATDIVRRLQKAGFTAFWVGGCVRDFLLGREPGDFDIATSALPEQTEGLFGRTVPVGRQFGVLLVLENAHEFQVATFRAEGGYQDGRHPGQVTFGDARADALRRDFTVNGLFYDPVSRELQDWVGGQADLQARLIRTIGSPAERFQEDHLRLLRAVRLSAQLGFKIESGTFEMLREHAADIRTISAERVRDELMKMFSPPPLPAASGPDVTGKGSADLSLASRGLELLRETGLLEHILPEVAATIACEQSPDFHPEGSVFNHLRQMLQFMPGGADPLLPWAVLLHDIAKPVTASCDPVTGGIHFYDHEKIGATMAEAMLERLRFSRKQIDAIVTVVRCHMQFKDVPQMRRSTLRRLLMRPTFPLELELHRLDCLGSHGRLDVYQFLIEQARALEAQPEIRPPLLTGGDLIALGFQPGPAMGKLLAEIREKQLQGELSDSEEARDWVRQQPRRPGAVQ
jgi:poly(A) polymerase